MATTAPLFHLDSPTDEELLLAALSDDPASWSRVTQQLRPYLTAVIRRRASAMPIDLRGEIIAELWTAVFLRGAPGFNPLLITARDYVASFVKDATDRVRAMYRAPGERSRARDGRKPRKRPSPHEGDQPRRPVLSLDRLPEEEQPEADGEWDAVDNALDIERAQALAAPDVALAIDLIRSWGVGFGEAANMVGLTRATLLRRLAQLGRRRLAA